MAGETTKSPRNATKPSLNAAQTAGLGLKSRVAFSDYLALDGFG
jgi:hypothetical protein